MAPSRKKITRQPEPEATTGAERRRIGRIVHDDRGNASVEWKDAPTDYKRPVLEIEGEAAPALSIQSDETFNPYEQAKSRKRKTGNTTRTDLRKLSEWIKMMRELEEKKRNDDTDD